MKPYYYKMLIFLLFITPIVAFAQINAGDTIFIAPMKNSFDTFIAGEMLNQKIPMTVTLNEKNATYILIGSSVDKGSNHQWYDILLGSDNTRDSVQASAMIVRIKDKSVIWADNSGDKSVWWGGFKRGGERKVAFRLVKKMKKDLFPKK